MKKYIENGESYLRVRSHKKEKPLNIKELTEFKIQNEILLGMCKEMFDLTPYAFSRDKLGNILIIENKTINDEDFANDAANYKKLNCYALAINNKKNVLCLYLVGELYYREKHSSESNNISDDDIFENNTIKIAKLSVHEDFESNGIGKVLLQAIENYTADLGYKYLTANSMIHFTHMKDKKIPPEFENVDKLLEENINESQSDLLNNPQTIAYIQSSYFDKNLYFYYKHGFVEDSSFEYRDEFSRPIVKKNITKVPNLVNLFGSSSVKVSKNDPIFRPEPDDDMLENVSKNISRAELFNNYKNIYSSRDLTIINLLPNKKSTNMLKNLIENSSAEKFVPQQLYDYLHHNINTLVQESFAYKTDAELKEINRNIEAELNSEEDEPHE